MATFSKVVFVGEVETVSPLFEQAEARLVRTVMAAPRYPLAGDVTALTEHAAELPAQTKEAVEPVVWALQKKHAAAGGAWQVDFYDPMGFEFMVVYLE